MTVKKYLDWIGSFILPDIEPDDQLMDWRNRFFLIFIGAVLPISYIIWVPSIYITLRDKLLLIAAADTLTFLGIHLIVFLKMLNIKWKKLLTIILCYFLALILFLEMGLKGPGTVYLVGISILSMLLISSRAGALSVLANTLVFSALCFAFHFDWVDKGNFGNHSVFSWAIIGLNLVAVNSVVIIVIHSLISRLMDISRKLQVEKHTLAETLVYRESIAAYTIQASKARSIDEIYRLTADYITHHTKADVIIVSTYDSREKMITAEYVQVDGDMQEVADLPRLPCAAPGEGIQSTVILTREQKYFPDLAGRLKESRFKFNISNKGIVTPLPEKLEDEYSQPRSAVYSPMMFNDEIIGVLQVQSYTMDGFNEKQNELLASVANILGVSVSNRKLFTDLANALDNATRANEVKELFLANMSHEIRTPLNSILGFTDILRERLNNRLETEDNQIFQVIDNSGKRLMNTVHSILDISQVRAGTVVPLLQPLDLSMTVERIFCEFRPQAESKKLVYRFTNLTGECWIMADENYLSTALANLVENAVKFTERGEVSLTLSSREGRHELSIADTGVGISKEYLDNMFDVFSQESTGYRKIYQGLGLGLSIAKSYLDINNVKLSVDSQKGVGTAFTLTFTPVSAP